MTDQDVPALLIDGAAYAGWTRLRVTRGVERCAADFDLGISERWPGQEAGWPLRVFMPAEIRFGDDAVITGYIDGVQAELEADSRNVIVSGRSKTADLIDCSALIKGGEFRDSEYVAICRSVAAPFGVEAVDLASVGRVVIPTEAADQTETCFKFLERLARQAGVLLTDDPAGRLVIARTGQGQCSSVIQEGVNTLSVALTMQAEKRFDRYVVKSQLPAGPSWISQLDRETGEARRPGADVQPAVTGEIRDAAVPRYRPFVMQSEGNADAAQARARALWQARRDAAESLSLKVSVQGWRQQDGRLWAINERIQVRLPSFGIDDEMLVATTSFTMDHKGGRKTMLTLGPPDAFTPEPADAPKAAGSTGAWWRSLQPATGA